MRQFYKLLTGFALILFLASGCSKNEKKDLSIIPKPVSQTLLKGKFSLSPETKIIAESNDLRQSVVFLQNYLFTKFDIKTESVEKAPDKNYIQLFLADTIKNKEGYILKVSNSSVEITGSTGAGVFYGIQTFLQMLPPEAGPQKLINVPAVYIRDFPRFSYRGQHIDVARHFFSVEYIKNMLDVMAMNKLNILHWHLTEDQGWRIEIKKYPKLTEIGAWRDSTIIGSNNSYPRRYDKQRYGGFFTQEEIKEVVQYAKDRYITVIPEIEMPGHSLAALASYPEFSCTGGPFKVATEWGIFEDVYCPGKEGTFEFLESVLDEVIQLFPGEYIHIGGDEVPKTRWENCNDCQRRMRKEVLKDENELQSYFVKRIENYLNDKGKKLIGWDEIIEGGLPERATVMSWRGMSGGITAAKAHHYTIMTPRSPCYFWDYEGKYEEPLAAGGVVNSLSDVYNFDPVPEELNSEEAKYIMGAQGCAWAEYMISPEIAQYMIFPRQVGLAEALWSEKSQKNWDDFLKRMDDHYLRLDYYNMNYRVDYPANYGYVNRYLETQVQVELDNIVRNSEIRYTTDGSEPVKTSKLYEGPVTLNLETPVTLKSRTFMPNGKTSNVHTGVFVKMEWEKSVSPASAEPGLNFKYFKQQVVSADEIKGEPDSTGVIDAVKFPFNSINNFFAIEFNGYIKVPAKAVYDFSLSTSRGKAILYIDDMNVVDNSAGVPQRNQGSGKAALEEGYHNISLKYFAPNSGGQVRVGCKYNDNEVNEIPASWFYH